MKWTATRRHGDRAQLSRRALLRAAAAGAGALVACPEAWPRPLVTVQSESHMKATPELHYRSVTEIAAQIAARELSPLELTELELERIRALDGRLKSYATVMAEQAREDARSAEREISEGRYRGPLHGVPIAVKDLCFTRGVRTMGGTKVRADFVPEVDATVVKRLRAAGAVLLGKLNLTEGAMAGYHPDFDIPVNPWNAGRWTGVSSSGSGVATAAGLCYACLGSDTGGSIRFPAAACGVVGLKPTWGRVSRHGVLALADSLDHVGPLARRVADCAIVLEAIAGHDPDDPTSLRDPVAPLFEGIDKGIAGLQIGLDERYTTGGVEPAVSSAVVSAVNLLEGLGARIVEVEMPDVTGVIASWGTLCSAEALAAHEKFFPARRDEYGPWFRGWLDIGASITGAAYAKANSLRAEFNGRLRSVFEQVDVLACPSMPEAPSPVTPQELYGPISPDPNGADIMRFTAPFDYSGSPTLSVPCGFTVDHLPLSLQLVGRHLDEALLCRIGHAYEAATDWHLRHPPV